MTRIAMRKRQKTRVDATGRNPDKIGSEHRVLIVRRALWLSPHISCLSLAARSLLIELLSMHNGKNNGDLFLSIRDATERLGSSDYRVAMSAFEELKCAQLISLKVAGHFAVKAGETSRAQAWYLNFVDERGLPRSADAMPALDVDRLPPKMRARMEKRQRALKRYTKDRLKGKFAVADNATLEARRVAVTTALAECHDEENAAPIEGPRCASNGSCAIAESSTHILHHSHSPNYASSGRDIGWCMSDLANAPLAAFIRGLLASTRLDTKDVVLTIKSPSCENCGASFATGRAGRPKRFCAEKCRKAAENRRRLERAKAAQCQAS